MKRPASIHAVCFPFDLFGNAGCGAGATLLADVVHEIVDDTDQETRPTRADAYRGRIEVTEFDFATPRAVADWRTVGARAVKKSVKENAFTLWLGGNHLSVLPVYESLGPHDLIVQFDAHLDIFDLHDTAEHLSHGNFLRHAASLPNVVNVGHRDLLLTDAAVRSVFADAIPATAFGDGDAVIERVLSHVAMAKRVWLDIDADVFDPAFAPAVHQRTPFGPAPLAILNVLRAIGTEKVIGLSVSEFDPGRDANDATLNLLGWLVEWAILRVAETR
jgi:agmatinase